MFAKAKPYTNIPWGVKTDMQGRNVTSIIHAIAILRAMTGSINVSGGSPLPPCLKAGGAPILRDRLAPGKGQNGCIDRQVLDLSRIRPHLPGDEAILDG
jgi:anaerobic selenocysteine-containing dehydrogenase